MKTNLVHAVPRYFLAFTLAFSLCLPTAGLAYATPDEESTPPENTEVTQTQSTAPDDSSLSPCIPSEEDIAKWEADGTLDERIAFQESLGNGEVSSDLIAQALQRNSGPAKLRSSNGNNLPQSEADRVSMYTVGDANVLAFLVDFPLVENGNETIGFKPGDTVSALQNLIGSPLASSDTLSSIQTNSPNSAFAPYDSLHTYYERSSYGKLNISGSAFSYKAAHPRSYYTDNINVLFAEICKYYDEEKGLDFSNYDANKDGYIDAVYLHFAGEDYEWGTTWWSNRNFYSGEDIAFDEKRIGSIVTLHLPSYSEEAVRTAIHETGHVLGLPDYYSYYPEAATTDRTGRTGILTFDMMNTNIGDHNAYSKWLLGWIGNDDITRVVANENGIIVKDASGTTTISPDELGNSSTEAVLELLSTNNTRDCGGFIAVSNNESLLDPTTGLFSSFYLLEYNGYAGNQIVSYQKGADRAPIPEGFRLFRIQAEIEENPDTGKMCFAHENRYDNVHDQFIELVDADSAQDHIEYIGSAPGSGNSYYGCMLMAGDKVTPKGSTSNGMFGDYPTSNFFENINMGFTGLSFEVIESNASEGSVRISYSLEDEPNISPDALTLVQSQIRGVDNTDVIELKANIPLTRSYNSDAAYIVVGDKKGHLIIDNLVYNAITVSYDLSPELFTPGATCELVFPEGYFFIGIDEEVEVFSSEIRVQLQVGNVAEIESKGTYENAVSDTCTASSLVTTQDGNTYFALIDKGELRLCSVNKSDPTEVGVSPITGMEETSAIFLHLTALPNNKLCLIVSAFNRDIASYVSTAYWVNPSTSSVEASMELPPTHLSSFETFSSSGNGLVVSFFVGEDYPKNLVVQLYDPQIDQLEAANTWVFTSVGSVHEVSNADGKLALKGTPWPYGLSTAKIVDIPKLRSAEQTETTISYDNVDSEIILSAPDYSEITGFALSNGQYLALANIAPEAAGSPDLNGENSSPSEEVPAWRGHTELKGHMVSFDQNGSVASSFLFGTYPNGGVIFRSINISPGGFPAAEIILDATDYGAVPRRVLFFKDGINAAPIHLTYDSTAFGTWLHDEAWLEIDFDRSYGGDVGEGEGIGGVGSPDLSGEGIGDEYPGDGEGIGGGEGDGLIGDGYEEESRPVHYLLAFLPSEDGNDGNTGNDGSEGPDPIPGNGNNSGNESTLSNTGDATGLIVGACAIAAIAAIAVAIIAFRASRKQRNR